MCQQSDNGMDQLLSQVEMDFVASVPNGNVPTEPISSAAPTPPPVAYSKAPARKEYIFAPVKSNKDVVRARNEGMSKKTASDTKYYLSLWKAWVDYRETENGNSIGPIEKI